MSAAVLYGWGLDVLCVLLGWGIVNANIDGVHMYDPVLLAGRLVTSFLVAWLVSCAGVLISMDAPILLLR